MERRLRDGAVEDWNDRARDDRRALLEAGSAGGPVHELRLTVPNRPGIVAQVALELGRAGVNIVDMALAPASDMRTGAMTLWIAGDAEAAARTRPDRQRSASRSAASERGRPLRPGRPAPGQLHASGRQVDLPSRGAVRGDGRRAGDGAQLPRLRGHALDAQRSEHARRGHRGGGRGLRGDPRGGPARAARGHGRPAERRQRRHADATAAGLARRAARAASGRSTATSRSASRPVDRIAEPLRAHGRGRGGSRGSLPALHRARRAS